MTVREPGVSINKTHTRRRMREPLCIKGWRESGVLIHFCRSLPFREMKVIVLRGNSEFTVYLKSSYHHASHTIVVTQSHQPDYCFSCLRTEFTFPKEVNEKENVRRCISWFQFFGKKYSSMLIMMIYRTLYSKNMIVFWKWKRF